MRFILSYDAAYDHLMHYDANTPLFAHLYAYQPCGNYGLEQLYDKEA